MKLRPRTGPEERALILLAHLEQSPAPAVAVCASLGWSRGQFAHALNVARNEIGPKLGVAIPHPVPDDGFCYRVTGAWLHDDGSPAIAAGTAYAMAVIETRLRAVLRDVRIAALHMDRRSIPGRKANFLGKHLAHILDVLSEIGPAPGEPDELAG